MNKMTLPSRSTFRSACALVLSLMFGFAPSVLAAPKKVLFYGPTHIAGGTAEDLIVNNAAEFAPIGQGSAVWSEAQWSSASLAQFQAFDAIVISDADEQPQDQNLLSAAIANRTVWTTAVANNNVLIITSDPVHHATEGDAGAVKFVEQGIRFAAEGSMAGPGLFVASGFLFAPGSPVDPNKLAVPHLLEGFGTFQVFTYPGSGAGFVCLVQVAKVASQPTLDCVTVGDLDQWGCSAHDGFSAWPSGFAPVAMVVDNPPANRPNSPGYEGMVHVLARSSGGLNKLTLSPAKSCNQAGTAHTITAKYVNATGQPIVGATVRFDITAGPNAALGPVDRPTLSNGEATWTYTGGSGLGEDTIVATVVTGGSCPPNTSAYVNWQPVQTVTVIATDNSAGEPGRPEGDGTFELNRTGDAGALAQPLTVSISLGGTANQSALDYFISNVASDGNGGWVVNFGGGVTLVQLTVEPVEDFLPEAPETSIVTILPAGDCRYKPGSPASATVTIYSLEIAPTVSLNIVESAVNESGNQTATLRLTRDLTADPILVRLGASGTATFGNDYNLEDQTQHLDPSTPGAVWMFGNESQVDILIRPVPDTRDEGASETVVFTILPAPDSSYNVGSPAQDTVTITDDDVTSLPASGWKLTVVGSGYGGVDEGLGLNNVGQVVGITGFGYACLPDYPYQDYEYCFAQLSGFVWNNGNLDYLPPWYWPYPEDNSSTARAINNDGIAVGRWLGHTGSHPGDPGWVAPSFWWYPYFDWNSVYMNTLPSLPFGTATLQDAATDINTPGIIVGQVGASFYPGNVNAVAWVPSGYATYPTALNLGDLAFGSKNSYAAAINDLGLVVGASEHSEGAGFHAFRSEAQSGSPLALTPSADMGTATSNEADPSEARDINNINELAGASWTLSGQYRAMYKTSGSGKHQGWQDLGVLQQPCPGNWSRANGINNLGLIVGQSTAWLPGYGGVGCVSLMNRAFVVSNQGNAGSQPMLNLTDLTYVFQNGQWYTAASQGWAIINAERINDSNWIVATAVNGGSQYAVLLTPR